MSLPVISQSPRHTPWDGSHAAFRIGLSPLDPADWIEVDAKLDAYLDEKDALLAEDRAAVFAEEAGTRAAQAEILRMLVAYLPQRFPRLYALDGGVMRVGERRVRLGKGNPALVRAARLVQEDLVLMRRDARGWRLAAACLCFPSSWSLGEKFGRPLQDIHRPVPGFGPDTRNAMLIERIFDRLHPEQPVWRLNWSLYADDALRHGENKSARFGAGGQAPGIGKFIRVEYQTLRKLPQSGDILFTIRIHVDPLAFIARHRDRVRLASALAASIGRLEADQLEYKGMTQGRALLLAKLEELAKIPRADRNCRDSRRDGP